MRTNYKIVPLTNLNTYLHYGTSEPGGGRGREREIEREIDR